MPLNYEIIKIYFETQLLQLAVFLYKSVLRVAFIDNQETLFSENAGYEASGQNHQEPDMGKP